MRSTPERSKTSMLCRASSRACSSRPACSGNAPQQPWSAGDCDTAAFRRQHAHRRPVDVREHQPLHAPGQQRDLHARWPTAGVCSGTLRKSATHETAAPAP